MPFSENLCILAITNMLKQQQKSNLYPAATIASMNYSTEKVHLTKVTIKIGVVSTCLST